MFPTHVGMNRLNSSARTSTPNVPHTCGDEPYCHHSPGTSRAIFPTHVGVETCIVRVLASEQILSLFFCTENGHKLRFCKTELGGLKSCVSINSTTTSVSESRLKLTRCASPEGFLVLSRRLREASCGLAPRGQSKNQ